MDQKLRRQDLRLPWLTTSLPKDEQWLDLLSMGMLSVSALHALKTSSVPACRVCNYLYENHLISRLAIMASAAPINHPEMTMSLTCHAVTGGAGVSKEKLLETKDNRYG